MSLVRKGKMLVGRLDYAWSAGLSAFRTRSRELGRETWESHHVRLYNTLGTTIQGRRSNIMVDGERKSSRIRGLWLYLLCGTNYANTIFAFIHGYDNMNRMR